MELCDCVEEVSTIYWRNDQTSLYNRRPTGGDDYVKFRKMPQFMSEGVLDLLKNISLSGMSL